LVSEQEVRVEIDSLLSAAGWLVCDISTANIHAARSVAIREFPRGPLIFAKSLSRARPRSHAEDIVKTVREEFGKGTESAQELTTCGTPKRLIAGLPVEFSVPIPCLLV
jgi:hypothetical protein